MQAWYSRLWNWSTVHLGCSNDTKKVNKYVKTSPQHPHTGFQSGSFESLGPLTVFCHDIQLISPWRTWHLLQESLKIVWSVILWVLIWGPAAEYISYWFSPSHRCVLQQLSSLARFLPRLADRAESERQPASLISLFLCFRSARRRHGDRRGLHRSRWV